MIKQYDAAFLVKELGEFLKKLRAYEPHNLQRDNVSAKKAWNDSQIIEGIITEYHKLPEKDKTEYKTFTDHSLKFNEIKENILPFIPEKIKKEAPNIEELMEKYLNPSCSLSQEILNELKKHAKKDRFSVLRIEEGGRCNLFADLDAEKAFALYNNTNATKYPTKYIAGTKRDIQKGREEITPVIINPDELKKTLETKVEPKKEIPIESKKEEGLEKKVEPSIETTEKKETAPELKLDPYLEILLKENALYVAIWREAGKLQPRRYNTAKEFLDDTKKHIIAGRKYYRRTLNENYEEIPSATTKSYLEKEIEKESKEPKKETTIPKNNSTGTNETELEKERKALQESLKEKSKP